ncbi:hypothetical protein D0686_10960 [Salmonella enterica]|nr:hypothetical protein [Salmonella enterica]EBY6473163.1 hypothetical protein [Salmonella enterica subsp. enterica serovar Hessarek]ECA5087340.1 hypothetical protein [Salmonella enterica subsp. enterica serovar Menston]ECA6436213.1 hypothetical protein [Salmonella enterica subsp. enterica serovar Senftenberg]ECA7077885.1 hypothetical protein [Salmonella enterica subsp. enterica serovar Senftenberg]
MLIYPPLHFKLFKKRIFMKKHKNKSHTPEQECKTVVKTPLYRPDYGINERVEACAEKLSESLYKHPSRQKLESCRHLMFDIIDSFIENQPCAGVVKDVFEVARKHIKEDAIDYSLFCKQEEKIKEVLRNVGIFSGWDKPDISCARAVDCLFFNRKRDFQDNINNVWMYFINCVHGETKLIDGEILLEIINKRFP